MDYTSEEDRSEALIVAVTHPKLFASLITEYSGKAIPGLLKNILVSQYKIGRKVAENVAETFKESIEFAGVYVNGVIKEVSFDREVSEDGTSDEAQVRPLLDLDAHNVRGGASKQHSMQSVTLPSGIVISYPTDIAYLFAIGKFGNEIAALNKAVTDAKPKKDNEHGDKGTSAAE